VLRARAAKAALASSGSLIVLRPRASEAAFAARRRTAGAMLCARRSSPEAPGFRGRRRMRRSASERAWRSRRPCCVRSPAAEAARRGPAA
jgi:hypothetical protein